MTEDVLEVRVTVSGHRHATAGGAGDTSGASAESRIATDRPDGRPGEDADGGSLKRALCDLFAGSGAFLGDFSAIFEYQDFFLVQSPFF